MCLGVQIAAVQLYGWGLVPIGAEPAERAGSVPSGASLVMYFNQAYFVNPGLSISGLAQCKGQAWRMLALTGVFFAAQAHLLAYPACAPW